MKALWRRLRRPKKDIHLEAARLRIGGDPSRRADASAFEAPDIDAWRARSRDHWRAAKDVDFALAEVTRHSLQPELVRMRLQALQRLSRRRRRNEFGAPIAAVAVAVAVVAAVLLVGSVSRAPRFSTDLAQRELIRLSDGSSILLDANSVVDIRYSGDRRAIDLKSGQARFTVAHGDARPFEVRAGSSRVVATGTVFNVEMLERDIVVTLLKGGVEVDRTPALAFMRGGPPILLKAGEQLIESSAHTGRLVRDVNVEHVTAWEQGRIMFDNVSLSEAITRINRYSAVRLSVGDPAVAKLRFSGAYNIDDTDAFVDGLIAYLSIQARREGDRLILGTV